MAFELRVVGYEFPDNTTDSVNWLFIEGAIKHPHGDWIFRHPSLLAGEVARLADWLEAVAAVKEPELWCGFIEPNLSFGIFCEKESRRLRVTFAAEARPPWAKPGMDAHVEFPVAELNLEQAVTSLRQQLQQWPKRPEVDDDA